MDKVRNIGELVAGSGYVDGYVSTDEFMDLLYDVDSNYEFCEGEPPFSADTFFAAYYPQQSAHTMVHRKTGLKIDYAEISIEEALEMRKAIGFMAMSRFRIHTAGRSNAENEIENILKLLNQERQNIALFNPTHTRSYLHLSEFY